MFALRIKDCSTKRLRFTSLFYHLRQFTKHPVLYKNIHIQGAFQIPAYFTPFSFNLSLTFAALWQPHWQNGYDHNH